MKEREEGYYWVKFPNDDKPRIAYWNGFIFFYDHHSYEDNEVKTHEEQLIPPTL